MASEELCAYYDRNNPERPCYPLRSHNISVAHAVEALLGERLRPTTPASIIPELEESLSEIATISALLHDIGKASPYYQQRVKSGLPGGFQYHEYVGATAILVALDQDELVEESPIDAAKLLIASAAIARHHAAMKCRHPTILLGEHPLQYNKASVRGCTRQFIEEVYNAITKLEPSQLEQATETSLLPQNIRDALTKAYHETPHLTKEEITGILREHLPLDSLARKLLGGQDTKTYALLPRPDLDNETGKAATANILYRTAGALIIADILVAGCERRPEGPQTAYAKSWLRELLPQTDHSRACNIILEARREEHV